MTGKKGKTMEKIEAEQVEETPEEVAQRYLDKYHAEQGMRALEEAMWEKYQDGRSKPSEEAIDYYTFDLKQGEKVIDQMTFKCSSEQEAYLRAEEAMVDGQECELVEVEPAI
jgi:hypothetical protein